MPDVDDSAVPACVTGADVREGKYVVVEGGKVIYQDNCIHSAYARREIGEGQLWRLTQLGWGQPTRID